MVAGTFLEFFAGGGLARLGLGPSWRCLFANDIDPMKCSAYRANFGGDHLNEGDIGTLMAADLPRADLAWASFPCQDLSLAGARGGLAGSRSGTFFQFMRLIEDLRSAGRAPRALAIENVTGLLTSRGGADFTRVITAVAGAGYTPAALVINASAFTPQSRPRLFIFGFSKGAPAPFVAGPDADAPAALRRAVDCLPMDASRDWRWLRAPLDPAAAGPALADIVDLDSPDWSLAFGRRAVAAMSARQRAALMEIAASGERRIGAAFFRIRMENGAKTQRLEARFDGLAGCLRTPAGGSSRQILLLVEGRRVMARRLSPREAARLMGAPDSYMLPTGTTAALKIMGDGVAPPVVRYIAQTILEPALFAKAAA